ncbi:unnamed protein product, partial [Rhizoctonia solani]
KPYSTHITFQSMSSPPSPPKPKKLQRQLRSGGFSRSQLRSTSHSQQHQDVGISSSTEGTGLVLSANSGTDQRLESLNPSKQAAYDSSLSIDINRRGCTEGTRVRVLADLNDWLYDSTASPVFWMDGMAGTGKTTIAFSFCELAEKRKILAATFFCTRSSADCRSMTRIIPTIAYQLARYSFPYRSALCEGLGRGTSIGSRNVLLQFEQLVKQPLQEMKDAMPKHSVVVIDGLDECEDRNGVELILDVLFRHTTDIPLRFLVTSRPEPEIYNRMPLQRPSLHLDKVERSLIQADIELYLKEELQFISLSPADREQLVERTGMFFIYAATLVRFIASGPRSVDPHKRLWSLLSIVPDEAERLNHIDVLYTAVLKTALEAGEREDIWVVLRTVLLAQEPIDITTIVTLTGIKDPQRIISALRILQSVFNHPRSTGLASTFHASFPDFMFDNERSGPYFCDVTKISYVLAQRCFVAMKEQLRFNICNLETSFVSDDKIEDIHARTNNMIPSGLAYACRFWTNYLSSAHRSEDLLVMLDEFLCNRLLFWVEVLSLRREVVAGIEALLKTKQWLVHMGHASSKLVPLVEDARKFVTGFAASPASQSTPHIYISLLPFCPRSSSVYKNYWSRIKGILELRGSLMAQREVVALATWNFTTNILSIACSPQGDRVAVGCFDKTVRILDSYDGTTLVGPLDGHTELAHSVAFSPDGRLVASGSYDGTIRVWNANNGSPICVAHSNELEGHICYVNSVSFSPDGKRIVSGSAAGTIRIWDANDGALLLGPLEGHNDWVRSVAFSPDGALVASASDDRTVRLWNSQDGTPTSSPFAGHTHWVMSINFSPDGTRLASGSRDQTVRVWNISDGSLVTGPCEGHTGPVYSVAISPDGTQVASGSSDGTIRVWNIHDASHQVPPQIALQALAMDGM